MNTFFVLVSNPLDTVDPYFSKLWMSPLPLQMFSKERRPKLHDPWEDEVEQEGSAPASGTGGDLVTTKTGGGGTGAGMGSNDPLVLRTKPGKSAKRTVSLSVNNRLALMLGVVMRMKRGQLSEFVREVSTVSRIAENNTWSENLAKTEKRGRFF